MTYQDSRSLLFFVKDDESVGRMSPYKFHHIFKNESGEGHSAWSDVDAVSLIVQTNHYDENILCSGADGTKSILRQAVDY